MEIFVTGVIAFVSTNVDDLFILALLFGSRQFSPGHIFTGQFLGIGLLTLAGVAGSMTSLMIDEKYVGLLGLFPVYLGIRKFSDLFSCPRTGEDSRIAEQMQPGVQAVAGITVANGADNIGVYIPFFATLDAIEKGLVIALFAAMTGLWCGAALAIARYPLIEGKLWRNGQRITPVILVLLGIYILYSAGSFALMTGR